MLDLKKLVSSQYLFNINSVMFERSDKLFFAFGIASVVLGLAFKLAAVYAPNPLDKYVRNRFYNLFLTIGLLEVLWFGARWQNVRFFGTHFTALLILLIGLIWFVFIIVWVIKNYRTEKVKWEKEQVKQKYLPV